MWPVENVQLEIHEVTRMLYMAICKKLDHEEEMTVWSHLDDTRLASLES